MDQQKFMMYAIIALVGLYFLRETCGLRLPFIDTVDTFEGLENGNSNANANANANINTNANANANVNGNAPVPNGNASVKASEELGNETFLRVKDVGTTQNSCYPQNSLTPEDLLPSGKSKAATDFDNANPTGEGILKGVNFLDAGFHVGVNTVGQSLRNANRQIRSEPPNPQVAVSPWLNTTIGPDLSRKALEDEDVCVKNQPGQNAALSQIGQSA
tara:strand:- start:122 stop:772 length:651 start_codon:yes stop_codon:yes gene_type:complete